MTDNASIVRAFIAAWPRLDVEEVLGYFSADAVYQNMPMGPVAGTDALRAYIAAFLKDWTATNWDTRNLVASGSIVFTERVDHIHVGAKSVDLPVCGVFELADGKITAWRDYFDLGTYVAAIS